jgi:hypothetical protein
MKTIDMVNVAPLEVLEAEICRGAANLTAAEAAHGWG